MVYPVDPASQRLNHLVYFGIHGALCWTFIRTSLTSRRKDYGHDRPCVRRSNCASKNLFKELRHERSSMLSYRAYACSLAWGFSPSFRRNRSCAERRRLDSGNRQGRYGSCHPGGRDSCYQYRNRGRDGYQEQQHGLLPGPGTIYRPLQNDGDRPWNEDV